MNLNEVASHFEGVKKSGAGFMARCSAHDDGAASLSLAEGEGGKVLVNCFAGCKTEDVLKARGLKVADLFPATGGRNGNGHARGSGRIVAAYDYRDETGQLLFQVVRFEPKDFRQRRPDPAKPDGWTWKLEGVRRVLFRLPEVAEAAAQGWRVVLAEGEKDALALVKHGFIATCNSGGAVSEPKPGQPSKWLDNYTAALRGAFVVIIADRDKPGREHAAHVAAKLQGAAASVKVVECPDVDGRTVKDAADFFGAGGEARDLTLIMDSAPEWQPAPRHAPASAPAGNPTADTGNHFRSDVGYADKLVQRFAGTIRFCADENCWLVFDAANGWRRDETNEIRAKAADYARELYLLAVEEAKDKEPNEGIKLVSSVVSLGNRKRVEPALAFAQCHPTVSVRAAELDADLFLVGARNGVIDLRDGSFHPHKPEHLVTRRLSANYDPTATAPTWARFLAEVQPSEEMRGFLQRLAGYSLTGEIREHVLPFHFGTGANGKGTFLEHAQLKLSGGYGAKLTDALVYQSAKGHIPHLEIANLCGKRFALGEENTEGGKLNENLLKSMTGGDRQKGRFHYANFIEYFPTYKVALVGNHKPRIDGTDDGIWRRFLLVDWPVQIPKERRDGQLKDKLAAEMSGILNWAVTGAREWMQHGLQPPECCTVATEAYRLQSDKLAEFIAEHFIQEEGATVTKAAAYAAYREWATRAGIDHQASKRGLGFQLAGRGWQETKSGHERQHCWVGYRLRGGKHRNPRLGCGRITGISQDFPHGSC